LLSLKVKRKVGLISELGKGNKFNGKSSMRGETSAIGKERNLGDKFRMSLCFGDKKPANPLFSGNLRKSEVKNPH
jgi:hypothetical protein